MTDSNMARPSLLELAAKIRNRISVSASGCWEWPGAHHAKGYGQVWCSATQSVKATHRIMVEVDRGPIPDGMQVDHLCRNTRCCNPEHLEIVTPAENTRRGQAGAHFTERSKLLTHCVHGHEINEANTYVQRDGRRQCRRCSINANHKRRALRRAAGLTQAGTPRKRELSKTAYTAAELESMSDA